MFNVDPAHKAFFFLENSSIANYRSVVNNCLFKFETSLTVGFVLFSLLNFLKL